MMDIRAGSDVFAGVLLFYQKATHHAACHPRLSLDAASPLLRKPCTAFVGIERKPGGRNLKFICQVLRKKFDATEAVAYPCPPRRS